MDRKKPSGTKKGTGILTKLVLLAIIVYAGISLISLRSQIETANLENEEYAQKIEALTASNAEMKYAIEHSDDPQSLEDIARDLGYVRPGETVFIDAEG